MFENRKLEKKVNKRPSMFKLYSQMERRRHAYSFFSIFKDLIFFGVALLLILFLMSGVVNQKALIKKAVNIIVDAGKGFYTWFNKLVTDESPVEITEDGFYLKGVTNNETINNEEN